MSGPRTDDDEVGAIQLADELFKRRGGGTRVGHVGSAEYGSRSEIACNGLEAIEPAGHETQPPPFAAQLACQRFADA
jgi:hypothetical protein